MKSKDNNYITSRILKKTETVTKNKNYQIHLLRNTGCTLYTFNTFHREIKKNDKFNQRDRQL